MDYHMSLLRSSVLIYSGCAINMSSLTGLKKPKRLCKPRQGLKELTRMWLNMNNLRC